MNINPLYGSPLEIFVEPKEYLEFTVVRSRWMLASVLVVLFIMAAIMSTYLVLREEGLVAEYLEKVVKEPPAGMSTQRLEAAKERTRIALGYPGMKIYLSLSAGASRILMLTVLWLVLGAAGALLGRSWPAFGKIVLAGAAATPILTLGTTANLLLRIGFRDLNAVASLLPLVGRCGGRSPVCFFIGTVDVFTLWYLIAVSLGMSAILQWPKGRALVLVVSLWASLMVCSFLTDTGAGWTQ